MRLNYVMLAVMLAGLVAGCSSASSLPASSASLDRLQDRESAADAMLVQCALTSGAVKPPTEFVLPAGVPPFFMGKRLTFTPSNDSTFNNWFSTIAGTEIHGEMLDDWGLQMAQSRKLPAAVCGTSATIAGLRKQVFAHDPARGNLWR